VTTFFTTGSAARELGVTPGRVRAMIAAGRLRDSRRTRLANRAEGARSRARSQTGPAASY
jgi:hypothetical protein